MLYDMLEDIVLFACTVLSTKIENALSKVVVVVVCQ